MSTETHRLFVYGTLLFAPVVERVLGSSFPRQPARLFDHSRWRLRDLAYPALVAEPSGSGAVVEGDVLSELDDQALSRLDQYEDEFYRRCQVTVMLRGGELQSAHCYVLAPGHDARLERVAWDPVSFERERLQVFISRLRQ